MLEMASPTSTIDFQSQASDISQVSELRSPSPFSQRRSLLASTREDGQGRYSASTSPGPYSDPFRLPNANVVHQLRSQVKQLQQDNNNELDNITELRRRLNESEKEKLQLTSAFNSENADLQAQLAKLRAQLEKSEADRQNVEYELAVARKSVNQEKHGAIEKEQQLKNIITSQSEKLSNLSMQVQELQSLSSQRERELVQMKTRHERELDEKEKQIVSALAERDVLQTGKEEIEQVFHEQESLYADAQEKLTELRIERDTQTQTVRQQLHDLQLTAEREEATKRELTAAREEMRELQERIEKERASHTESKFNFEIVQCQKRDLEGALSVEKSAREQAMYNMEAMGKQIRELESAYQEERRECTYNKEQLKRMTADYETCRNALSAEVDQKQEVLAGTSQQIDIYQKNFNGLKEELGKAKKRQVYLEETYGGCMREMELLLTGFHVLGEGNLRPRNTKKTKGKGKKGGESHPVGTVDISPSVVLETLRHTLTDYQQRLDQTSQELKRMKTIHEKLANECEHYKEITITREHMVKDLQGKLSKSVKELEKVKGDCGEKEAILSRLKVKLQKAEQKQENEQSKAYSMADEFIRQLTALEEEQEARKQYLHNLYQRLLAGRVVMKEKSSKSDGASSLTWQDLSVAVQEEVIQLMNNGRKAHEQVVALEGEMRKKKERALQTEEGHREALEKLAQTSQQREADFRQQKEELERRYQRKLQQLEAKSEKSKVLASDALSKARHDNSARQELETQITQLTATLADLRRENSCLLAGCALLSGALLPVYSRLNHLAAQRHILQQQMVHTDVFRRQARELAQTLSMEIGAGHGQKGGREGRGLGKGRSRHCLLLRFRVAAVAVMAANRLVHLAGQSSLLFTFSDNTSGSCALPVCIGNPRLPQKTYSGISSRANSRTLLEAQTGSWLASPDLLNRIVSSVADLQQLIEQSGTGSGPSPHSIHQSAMSAFENLMSRLGPCFPSPSSLAPSVQPGYAPYHHTVTMERGPLMRSLGHGLSRLLSHSAMTGVKNDYVTTELVIKTLQNQMVDFLDRLHEAEVDRRTLKKENAKFRQEAGQLRLSSKAASDLQKEVLNLQEKVQSSVGREKFESICQELQQALTREQEAQRILTEQSHRLEDLGLQLNVKTTEELEKDHNITEAIKGLSEAKMELRRKEQSVRQLGRQLSQLEGERKALQDSLNAAESALKASTRDRESFAGQLRSLQSVIASAKHQIVARADSQAIDSALAKVEAQLQVTPVSSPDMIALQNLVSTFLASQKVMVSRLSSLELEITSHKQHIARLKDELSDACTRQMAEGQMTPAVNGYHGTPAQRGDESVGQRFKTLLETDRSCRDVFLPLKEVPDYSMQVTSTPAIARQDYLAGTGMATPASRPSPIKQAR